MSVSVYYYKKAYNLTVYSLQLTWLKLANAPGSFVKTNITDLFAAKGTGDDTSFGQNTFDLIKNNSTVLLGAAIAYMPSKYKNAVQNGLTTIYNVIAAACMAQNDMIFFFMKKVARNAVIQIGEKKAVLLKVRQALTELYNVLMVMASGDPVMDEYIEQLRDALATLDVALMELKQVRGGLNNSVWIGHTFKDARERMTAAETLIKPLENNDFLKPTTQNLMINLGFPAKNEQIAAIVKLPQLMKECLDACSGYLEHTAALNALIVAFGVGVGQLQKGLPDLMKNFLLGAFTETIDNLDALVRDMGLNLNGDEAYHGHVVKSGFSPTPFVVSALTYKWYVEIKSLNRIVSTIVPEKALAAWQNDMGLIQLYESINKQLAGMNTVTQGRAILVASGGQESTGSFEIQLATFLTEAGLSIVSPALKKQLMALGQANIERCDLSIKRDEEIRVLLQQFIDYPLPLEDLLNDLGNGIMKMMKDLGLDGAIDMLENGSFDKFFKLDPAFATYVGAALAFLALLKQCYDTQEDVAELAKFEDEINGDKDLWSLQLSFDFDLAIFTNAAEILALIAKGNMFLEKEIICNLMKAVLGTSPLDPINKLIDKIKGP